MEGGCLKVRDLKKILEQCNDDLPVYLRKGQRLQMGNIAELDQVELSTYQFFGTDNQCVILNTEYSKPEIVNDKGVIEEAFEDNTTP